MKILISIIILVYVGITYTLPIKEHPFNWNNFKIYNKNIGTRITGGKEATPYSFPYQVSLSLRKFDGTSTLCGGSLISKHLILTAAHCLHNTNFLYATLGVHNLRKGGIHRIKIDSKNFLIYPQFNLTTLNNDIALIRIDKRIKLNDKIQLIKLPGNISVDIDSVGTPAIASGWGKFSDDNKQTSDVLRYVDLVIFNQNFCMSIYNEDVVKSSNLCTNGSYGKSTCNGDSGSPLIIKNDINEKIQIGISSFGSVEGCEKGYPAVFTRITSYMNWINENYDF